MQSSPDFLVGFQFLDLIFGRNSLERAHSQLRALFRDGVRVLSLAIEPIAKLVPSMAPNLVRILQSSFSAIKHVEEPPSAQQGPARVRARLRLPCLELCRRCTGKPQACLPELEASLPYGTPQLSAPLRSPLSSFNRLQSTVTVNLLTPTSSSFGPISSVRTFESKHAMLIRREIESEAEAVERRREMLVAEEGREALEDFFELCGRDGAEILWRWWSCREGERFRAREHGGRAGGGVQRWRGRAAELGGRWRDLVGAFFRIIFSVSSL